MQNRYENIKIIKTEEGRRYKKTIQYPKMEKTVDDKYIIGRQGDRLDNLAFTFYDDSSLWWILSTANGIQGKMVLEPGTLIRIPGNISNIIQKFRNANG